MKSTPILLFTTTAVLSASFFLYQPPSSVFKIRSDQKPASSDPYFMRWAQADLSTGKMNPNARSEVFEHILHRASRSGNLGLEFVQRGPDNIGGRTRAILELYGKPESLLVGSMSGGLYWSNDGGGRWFPHTQFQNLANSSSIISSICQDTMTGNIYVGTGCSFDDFDDISWPGYGIYVSEDEGKTFRHLASTTPSDRYSQNSDAWVAINRIAVSPSGRIYAATHRGLRMSSDNGETWINPIYLTSSAPNLNVAADVAITKTGRVVATLANGAVFISETGDDNTFEQINQKTGLPTEASRTCVTISPQDEDKMYILYIESKSQQNPKHHQFMGVFATNNGGETWTKILQPFDNFNPMSSTPTHHQGTYNAAIAVSPTDPNTIFLGGVQLWRYDGNLTRIASEFGSPPYQDVLPNYVHADKHYLYFSPNNRSRLYATSDGGISMTTNRGDTWQGLNKGYISTQFYGIAHDNGGGIVVGGTQDNGTIALLNNNDNDQKVGFSVFSGDGFDCEVSQYSGIYFVSSQNGAIGRGEQGLPTASLHDVDNASPFATVVRLWETLNDPLSKDSIEFRADPVETPLGTSEGILRSYSGTVTLPQPAAQIIKPSFKVYSGDQSLDIDNNLATLAGDGSGSVSFNEDGTIDVAVTFNHAPPVNSNIYIFYEVEYKSHSILYIESKNLKGNLSNYIFEYTLEDDLAPGEVIKIQDPVQSLLATNAGGKLSMYRNPLNVQRIPEHMEIEDITGDVTCVEFTSDGSAAFAGTLQGRLYRIENLEGLYTEEDLSGVSADLILNMTGGITGLAIDPTDNNRLIVTGGGYNSSDRVRLSTNALAAAPSFVNVHGDLPPMPVYDAEIDRNNPDLVVLGTEFGIWATEHIESGAVSWADENQEVSYVPVYDVRQQKLPWHAARNSGMYYIGTHGRGILESSSLVGIDEFEEVPLSAGLSGLRIYPNPVPARATISFTAQTNGLVNVKIYDLEGRQVQSWQEHIMNGVNNIGVNAAGLRQGYYVACIENGNDRSVAKFIVAK